MVFSLFYWNINSDIQIKNSFLLKFNSKAEIEFFFFQIEIRTKFLLIFIV